MLTPLEQELATYQRALELCKQEIAILKVDRANLLDVCCSFLAAWDGKAYDADELVGAIQDNGILDAMRASVDKAKGHDRA